MKKNLLLFLISFSFTAFSQQYGNEWINYNQKYYRIKIINEGIYRINYTTLVNAGFFNDAFDPKQIQIFHNGKEEHIYVKGENDHIFDPTDYIQFYAKGNNGWLDSVVYNSPLNQVNKNYSLYNDTAAYYLTWNSSLSNKRDTIVADTNYTGYTLSPYCLKNRRADYVSTMHYGPTDDNNMSDMEFTQAEGWFDSNFLLGSPISKQINTANAYTLSGAPDANIEIMVVGAANDNTIPDHHLKVDFAGTSTERYFDGYKNIKIDTAIPASTLTNGNTAFNFSLITIPEITNTDYHAYTAVSYIDITYPHTYNFENADAFHFFVPNTAQLKSYLNITNFNIGTDSCFVYDLTNHKIIKVKKTGGILKALIQKTSAANEECYITKYSKINNIASISPVNGTGLFFNFASASSKSKDYLIITNKSLMATSDIQAYSNYRSSSLGGNFNVLIADVTELYDQFAYGIGEHPQAIRNFCNYAVHNFDIIPKYLFLIGKGYRLDIYRNNTSYYAANMIPSYGNYPSDVLFTNKLDGDTLFKPAIPTGRLSAKTPFDVYLYLEKMKDYEAQQANAQIHPNDYEWMKNIINFGGGNNAYQQLQLSLYLQDYEKLLEDTFFGGNTFTFLKNSTVPVQITTSDSIKNLIETGVSILNFFGHGSGTNFDQCIDNFKNYNNYLKYPFMLANSCYTGDLFDITYSKSEEFVLSENNGVIAYLASTYLSLSIDMNNYSKQLYHNVSALLYGESIGKQIQNTIKLYQSSTTQIKNTCLEMTLHGDPALKINYFIKPNYMLNQSSVYTTPLEVTNQENNFILNVISTNTGRAVKDSFIVEVERTFPDNVTKQLYLKFMPATLFKDTIKLNIPIDSVVSGIGLNSFRITLDATNKIPEIKEDDNTIIYTLNIKSANISPVYPYKYAIVPSLSVTLKATTDDPFAAPKNYVFEIDTTDAFNSPLKQHHVVNHSGGVVQWTPTFTYTPDSVVYFWRVSYDSTSGNPFSWRESSFQKINNQRGWSQAHFFQFKNDNYQYVTYNKPQRKFDFVNTTISLTTKTGFYPYIYPWTDEKCLVNNSDFSGGYWSCTGNNGNGLKFVVFNPNTGERMKNNPIPTGKYGSTVCHAYADESFDFNISNSTGRDSVTNFINNIIPPDYWVLVFSHRNSFIDSYDAALEAAFASIGSLKIPSHVAENIHDNQPFIVFGQKGHPLAHETFGSDIQAVITQDDDFPTNWTDGYVISEIVGPGKNWDSLHWRFNRSAIDTKLTDSVKLKIYGTNTGSTSDTVLLKTLTTSYKDYKLTGNIDTSYKYLYLKALMRDDTFRTPAQMKRWQVMYAGAPETALDPSLHYYFYNTKVQEGDYIKFAIATHNISEYNMDTLRIKYWVVDKNRVVHSITTKKNKPQSGG
ncbi:MAG: C25 family cysteine peptidase [Bacteroidales bacterium]|jgi:hypothetical protein